MLYTRQPLARLLRRSGGCDDTNPADVAPRAGRDARSRPASLRRNNNYGLRATSPGLPAAKLLQWYPSVSIGHVHPAGARAPGRVTGNSQLHRAGRRVPDRSTARRSRDWSASRSARWRPTSQGPRVATITPPGYRSIAAETRRTCHWQTTWDSGQQRCSPTTLYRDGGTTPIYTHARPAPTSGQHARCCPTTTAGWRRARRTPTR